ncbi:MAG: hypothetical protein IPN38_19105 [Flavobacteriales bacterium]|nr:hypothetical protein [Flavobacteriales bacterium]
MSDGLNHARQQALWAQQMRQPQQAGPAGDWPAPPARPPTIAPAKLWWRTARRLRTELDVAHQQRRHQHCGQ